MALISLEDLEGLDEQMEEAPDAPEAGPAEEEERLLSHWRAVASTHQVSVPTEMSRPIQEMSRHGQQREPLPHGLIQRHEKMGEVLFEERLYPAGFWASVSEGAELYEQSISMAFMKLMCFICKENSSGTYLGMTVPVVSTVHLTEDGTFHKEVETAFFLPAALQSCPPRPLNAAVSIVHREPIRVLARTFFGTTTEQTVSPQIRLLEELSDRGQLFHRRRYMVAVYDNPGAPRRRNEIWLIGREM